MGAHSLDSRGSRNHPRKHRRIEPYAWLGAGALTLGLGAGLASFPAVAHADDSSGATPSSATHDRRSSKPERGNGSAERVRHKSDSAEAVPTSRPAADNGTHRRSERGPERTSATPAADVAENSSTSSSGARKSRLKSPDDNPQGAQFSPSGVNQPLPHRRLAITLETRTGDAATTDASPAQGDHSATPDESSAPPATAARPLRPLLSTVLAAVGVHPIDTTTPTSPSAPAPLTDIVSAAYRTAQTSEKAAAAAASPPSVVTSVPLGDGAAPYYVVVSPKGDRTYVVTTSVTGGASLPASTVIGVDTSTNKPVGPAVTVGYVPINGLATTIKPIAFSPDGRRVYVASLSQSATGALASTVTVIDAANGQIVGDPIALSSAMGASGLMVSPDGGRLYTANGDGTVSVFDLLRGNAPIGGPIPIGSTSSGFGGPGADIVIATNDAQTVYISDWAEHAVYVLDASTNTVSADPIHIDGSPVSLALSADNSRLVVNSMRFDGAGGSTNQANITVIDTSSRTVIGEPISYGVVTSGFSTTGAMAISRDGRYVYTPSLASGAGGTSTAALWKIDTVSRTASVMPVLGLSVVISNDGADSTS